MNKTQNGYLELFGPASQDVSSDIFRVFPGDVWQFQAFNFMSQGYRDDETITPSYMQEACLQQVIFNNLDFIGEFIPKCSMAISERKTSGISAVGPVLVNGCCMCLNACNTVAFLDMPGEYRFILNDPTALQVVKIVARSYNKNSFPFGSAAIFGR